VRFVNDSFGYAIGNNGNFIRSKTGGQTWERKDVGVVFDLQDALFLDTLNGFVAGASGFLTRTTNGGDTWTTLPKPTNRTIFGLFYVKNALIALCDSGTILRSTNLGQTWQTQNLNHNYPLLRLHINSQGIGMLCGEQIAARTTDFGVTWQVSKRAAIYTSYRRIAFTGDTLGVAIGSMVSGGGGNNALSRTRDGGKTWSHFYYSQLVTARFVAAMAFFKSLETVAAVSNFRRLARHRLMICTALMFFQMAVIC
jgi:photosystem II stability/assembly factor-like uncharacterized protein